MSPRTCGDEHAGQVCVLDQGHTCFHASFRSGLLGHEPVAVWPRMVEAEADTVPGQVHADLRRLAVRAVAHCPRDLAEALCSRLGMPLPELWGGQ